MILWNDAHKNIKLTNNSLTSVLKLLPLGSFSILHLSKRMHFLTNQMVNTHSSPKQTQDQCTGQQLPPPPLNPTMEQFIAAQMQLLQGVTASVQQHNNNNKAFLSQACWGRLEMKPHMKTLKLNPQRKEKGDKGKGEPKNDKTGKHIKRDKTHKNQQDLKGHKKRSND
jgi:hypothetical protein